MNKKIALLLFSSILFVGCNTQPITSEVVNNELTAESLKNISNGYTSLGILKSGYTSLGFSYSYVNASATSQEYTCTTYESSDDNPTMDKIKKTCHYVPYRYGLSEMLCEVELGLDNKIHYYQVTSSSIGVTWREANYGNAFDKLKVSSFKKVDNGYELIIDSSLKTFTSALANQLTGMMGLELESFVVTIENGNFSNYKATFKDVETSYGFYKSEIEGKFINFGENVITPITPIEGNEDSFLQETLEKLRKQNYHLKVELASKIYEVDIEDGKSMVYDIYNLKNIKTNSYGYYQKNDSQVQGIVKINNELYENLSPLDGNMSSILPTFNISSVFFDKKIQDDQVIYTLKDDIKCTVYASDYGTLGGDNIGKLTITISNDQVVITNKLKLTEEVYTYSSINQISNLLSSLHENSNSLKWSDLLSNQVSEVEKLYKTISQDVLNQIPTIGDKYTLVSVDASYNPSKPVIMLAFDDYTVGLSVKNNYLEKLQTNGFVLQTSSSKGDYFTKNVTVNNQNTTIGVLVYLAADYFKTTQLLIYPSIIE